MIQLQPDIIVARISNTMTSMISIASASQDTALKSSNSVQTALELQDIVESTREENERPQNDSLVKRQYHYWTSSPS